MLDVDRAGLDVMDRKLLSAVVEKFMGARSGWTTSPQPSARNATPSRTCSNPISSSRATCSAPARPHRHAAGVSPSRPRCPVRRTRRGSVLVVSFHWPVRVYWEDTDAGGVGVLRNYLKFMERARSEWLRACGSSRMCCATKRVVFVVRRVEIDYLSPARFNDQLDVSVSLHETGRPASACAELMRGSTCLARAESRWPASMRCVSNPLKYLRSSFKPWSPRRESRS